MKRYLKEIHIDLLLTPAQTIRDKISIDDLNELIHSIRTRGLLQPLLVKPNGDNFEIVAGHRRYLAVKEIGYSTVPCYVVEYDSEVVSDIDKAHENLIRVNLNIIEEAKLVKSLVYENDRGVEEVANILSKSFTWVDNRLAILEWPEDVLQALEKGTIILAVGKELSKVKNESQRLSLLESAIQYGVPARVVKQWIDDFSVQDYLQQKKISKETGELVSADSAPVYMPCRVCGIKYEMNLLRHIWLCPECIVGVRHLAGAVQEEMDKQKTVES